MVVTLALWFSATAVIPSIEAETNLTLWHKSLFTSAVQIGFVAGTLTSAYLSLADRLDPRWFFAASALMAATANAAILGFDATSPVVIAMRFITGACMAGIYPVGMKIATTWAKGDMGLLVGATVAAVTLGSGMPHLVNAFGGVDWRFTIAATSIAALGAAGLITLVKLGPNLKPTAPFNPKAALYGFKNKALRRANFGYLGHMWELYAMWAWILIFLNESFKLSSNGDAQTLAKLASFAIIGLAGGLGCLAGGILADRLGRTTVTITAMTISGLCAVSIGFFFAGPPWILFAIAMIWGASIVADSPQFSATIVELSPPERIGTMLTVQTCAGFLLTLSTIHLMPYAVELLSWRYAFIILAAGPLFGIIAMARLRNMPEAAKLAGGKR